MDRRRVRRKTPIRFGDVPVPEAGPRDVLVRVAAAGINPLDSKPEAGECEIPLPYTPPFVLGNDVSSRARVTAGSVAWSTCPPVHDDVGWGVRTDRTG